MCRADKHRRSRFSIYMVDRVMDQICAPISFIPCRQAIQVYEDIEVIPKIIYCYSRHMEIWLGTLYIYKGLLLAFGCFLAWETRHVNIPALNDSKYIGMSVYNVVIMCVCGAAVSFIIEDKPTQSFIIIGLFIVFCTTITLCLVFLPKIYQLKLNPKGDEQRVRATLNKLNKTSNSKSEYSVHREKVKATLEENHRLRRHLEQKANELENLLEQLGDDVIKDDADPHSALPHKNILALRYLDGSPGKLSMKSSCASDAECISTYSEGSYTTTVFTNDESPPTSSLLKNRFNTCKHYSEVIEMAGIRFSPRKCSLTLPPAAEEEIESDPFGGVYLGPSDTPDSQECTDRVKRVQEIIGEKQPLIASSAMTHSAPFTPGNASDSHLDNSAGAQGLRTSFGSVDTNPWNLTQRIQQMNSNGTFPNLHVMAGPHSDASYREVFASDDIVLL